MPNVTLQFNVKRATGLLNSSQAAGADAGNYLLRALQAAVSGRNQSDGLVYSVNDATALGDSAYAGEALAALVMTGSSGAVGGTIAGTLVTVVWATSDTASSTALVAAIRASAAINRKVTATNLAMKVTLATVLAGQYIDICNVRFTAVNGAPVNVGEFDMSGADTADALSLAQAINRHPAMALRYRAVSSVGAVFIFPSTSRALTPTVDKWAVITNPGSFSTFTINTAIPTLGPTTAILASVAGDIGNEVRCVASGTNVTALTSGSAGFLGHGMGGGVDPKFYLP